SPRYFFASLSICASAPSSVSSAGPLTATHLNESFGSTISSEARGSRSRCFVFARPRAVLKETFPSSTSTQTIVAWGDPSARRVVTTPTFGLSSRNLRGFSPSFAIPHLRLFRPTTTRAVSVFPNGRPPTRGHEERALPPPQRRRSQEVGARGPAAAGLARV